jgi:hypothetical protein
VLRRAVTLDFPLVSCNGGLNFYLGNHPSVAELNYIEHPRFFLEYQRAMRIPVEAGIAHTAQQSSYLTRLAVEAQTPAFLVSNTLRKLRQLLSGYEIQRNIDGYALRQDSPLLALTLWIVRLGPLGLAWPSGVLVPLGLFGALLAWTRHKPGATLLGLFLLVHCAYIVAFFVTDRYRAEILPLLAIGTVVGIVELRRAQKPLLWLAAGTLLLLSNLGLPPMPKEQPGYVQSNLGMQYLDEGRLDEALGFYERAVALMPQQPMVWYNYGNALEKSGRLAEARKAFELSVAGAPRSLQARLRLARVAAAQQDSDAVVAALQAAHETRPCAPEILLELASLLAAHPELKPRLDPLAAGCSAQ